MRVREEKEFLYVREAAIYAYPCAPMAMETGNGMHFDGNAAQAYPTTSGKPAETLVVTAVDHG